MAAAAFVVFVELRLCRVGAFVTPVDSLFDNESEFRLASSADGASGKSPDSLACSAVVFRMSESSGLAAIDDVTSFLMLTEITFEFSLLGFARVAYESALRWLLSLPVASFFDDVFLWLSLFVSAA